MEITKRIIYLLHSRVRQELDERETAELKAWANRHPAFQRLLDEVSDEKSLTSALQAFDQVYGGDRAASIARMEERITEAISYGTPAQESRGTSLVPKRRLRLRKWLPYAAAMLIAVTTATYFFFGERLNQAPKIVNLETEDIGPGGNRATLTLADGRAITLDEARDGIVIGGGEITYNDGGPLVEVEGNEEVTLLELTTPKGGTYQITLPDGSRVWLNAASTLIYPPAFDPNERVVEIAGEAYFSVVKDAHRPFKVISSAQTVNVLGTEFNISAYGDEKEIRTTLIEGSVSLEPSASGHFPIVLKPGQQATLNNDVVDVKDVNTTPYIAWKDGLFYFEDTSFDVMMRQIARWYNVDVVYKKGIPKESFSGKFRRSVTLEGVLKMLRTSDINIVLRDSTVIVN